MRKVWTRRCTAVLELIMLNPRETRLMSITPLDMKAVHLHDRCVALVPAPALSISAGNLHHCSLSLLLLSAY